VSGLERENKQLHNNQMTETIKFTDGIIADVTIREIKRLRVFA
jgi:hypothetical protein